MFCFKREYLINLSLGVMLSPIDSRACCHLLKLDSCLVSKNLYRLWITHLIHLHDEIEHGTMFFTAKAVITASFKVQLAGWFSFITTSMKWTFDPFTISMEYLSIGRYNIYDAELTFYFFNGLI